MSPAGQVIAGAVREAVRRLRLEGAITVGLAAAVVVPAVLLVAWVWGPPRWAAAAGLPLALVVLGCATVAALAVLLGRLWVAAVDDASVAAAAERRRSLPEGSLRGVLELGRGLSPGGSPALFGRTEAALAGTLAGVPARELAGELGERARRRRLRVLGILGATVAVTALAAFAAPERAKGAWSPLLNPVTHLGGPALPALTVTPGNATVARGGTLELGIEAPYRTRVTVHWRATGAVPRERTLGVERGRAVAMIGPIESPLLYWVVAPDGAVSDTFRVDPVDPLMVTALAIDLMYPAHVGLEPDHFQGEAPPLRVPAGTVVRVRGRTTRPAEDVTLRREDGRELRLELRGATFSMDWRPGTDAGGRWAWRLVGGEDDGPAIAPAPLDLTVVPDAPPHVRVTFPGRDTIMPAGFRQQVVADASDDHGLASAELVYWHESALGGRGSELRVALPVESGVDRALLRTVLDASDTPLAPGDAIHYRVVVRDNSPAGQVGTSATYVLRLPALSELRGRARAEAGEVLGETQRLADEARRLERATRNLSRRSTVRRADSGSRGASGRGSEESRLDFQQASEGRQLVEDHDAMLAEMAALRQRMEELERAIEAAGLKDPELQRKLAELRDLQGQLATPGQRQELDALRQAVDELDPAAMKEALDRLAAQQEELRKRLEESLELMRRAAAEQEMSALAREAEEVAAQQEALAAAMREDLVGPQPATGEPDEAGAARRPGDEPRPGQAQEGQAQEGQAQEGDPRPGQDAGGDAGQDADGQVAEADSAAVAAGQTEETEEGMTSQGLPSPEALTQEQRAKQQDDLAERAEDLNKSMQSLQQQLLQIGQQDAAQQTGSAQQQSEASQRSMQKSAEEARQGKGADAAQSGEQAAGQMSDAARTLDAARKQMAEAWQEEARQAVQQATQEALSLAEREEALRRQMEQAQQGGAQGELMQQMRSEQAALQQGLQQLGRNLSEMGQQSALLDRQVGQALARAMLNMEQTLQALQDGPPMPVQQAGQTVESLNQLAMALLQNDVQLRQAMAGGALQQALQQLADLAREQGSLNAQLGSLAPLDLNRRAMSVQLQQLGQQQRGIARRMGEVSEMMGGQDHGLGRLDLLSSEALAIARELEGERLTPEVMARQQRLFHRLLDAGRSLEREEYSDERVGDRASAGPGAAPAGLDPSLVDPSLRYPPPTAEQLRSLPPAYRRLILEYFDRLNAGTPSGRGAGGS